MYNKSLIESKEVPHSVTTTPCSVVVRIMCYLYQFEVPLDVAEAIVWSSVPARQGISRSSGGSASITAPVTSKDPQCKILSDPILRYQEKIQSNSLNIFISQYPNISVLLKFAGRIPAFFTLKTFSVSNQFTTTVRTNIYSAGWRIFSSPEFKHLIVLCSIAINSQSFTTKLPG